VAPATLETEKALGEAVAAGQLPAIVTVVLDDRPTTVPGNKIFDGATEGKGVPCILDGAAIRKTS
jgi:hypothetical protein